MASPSSSRIDASTKDLEVKLDSPRPSPRSGSRTGSLEIMAELQLTLTPEERDYLVGLLETTLKNTRIEEHRTRTLSYREHVVHQEDLLVALLNKLGQPTR
jgi:hypothetical protein